jgi:hypothetical protein
MSMDSGLIAARGRARDLLQALNGLAKRNKRNGGASCASYLPSGGDTVCVHPPFRRLRFKR